MLKVEDNGNVTINCDYLDELIAEMGILYKSYLTICEENDIPWGNAAEQLETCMRNVEHMYATEKHASIKTKLHLADGTEITFTDDNE